MDTRILHISPAPWSWAKFFHNPRTFFPWNEVEDDGCDIITHHSQAINYLGWGPCQGSYQEETPVGQVEYQDTLQTEKGYANFSNLIYNHNSFLSWIHFAFHIFH